MGRAPTAREIEAEVALARPPRGRRAVVPSSEALAMLVRRGLRPRLGRPDVPFDPDLPEPRAERLSTLLGHYAFRLFLRGAILRGDGFDPAETTPYVSSARAEEFADALAGLGIAERVAPGRYRLTKGAANFGGTLEWYVGREMRRTLGFDVATGVKFHARGVGGDLDVVAAAEGKLVYLELKSAPPKHLSAGEVDSFLERLDLLRPDLALFVVDTALRLSDRVVAMLVEGIARRTGTRTPEPRRIERELWALSPHLYVVNSRPDLMGNLARTIKEGLRALSPFARPRP